MGLYRAAHTVFLQQKTPRAGCDRAPPPTLEEGLDQSSFLILNKNRRIPDRNRGLLTTTTFMERTPPFMLKFQQSVARQPKTTRAPPAKTRSSFREKHRARMIIAPKAMQMSGKSDGPLRRQRLLLNIRVPPFLLVPARHGRRQSRKLFLTTVYAKRGKVFRWGIFHKIFTGF